MIKAKIIAHSINPEGKELISIEAVAPYFLDAEIEKHGQICSNSSSNRAIPFSKMVNAEFYIPQDIRKNEKGMQGFESLDEKDLSTWNSFIKEIREDTVDLLYELEKNTNVHKQHLNRYLAPWSMQKKILTGTREAWNGVMLLRDHEAADPSIQIWAREIKYLLDNSKPVKLEYGDWHLPYITDDEKLEFHEKHLPVENLLKMSAARCARTSYRLHDGNETTVEEDFGLFDKLVGGKIKHATPLDHQGLCVKPVAEQHSGYWQRGQTHIMRGGDIGSGRLTGWVQFRHWYDYNQTI